MKARLVLALSAFFLFAATLDAQTPTTTTLTAGTPSPSVFGQSVTLSAQVSPAGASGSLAFMDGVVMLGAGPLNGSGGAQLTTISLTAGSHSLRAVFGGDSGGFQPSQSTSLPYVVNVQPGAGLALAGSFATGAGSRFAASADFNGDGKADLAVANNSSNDVSILLGNGNGTFQSAVNYGAGTGPWFPAVGDFNGDGVPDLAVANSGKFGSLPSSNNVSILLGNGDGTFQSAVNFTVGTRPVSVAVGDFNGDGRADLAVANDSSHSMSVLLGNGNGTFQSAVNYASPYSHVSSVVVGDFNGDGIPDLVMGTGKGNEGTEGPHGIAINYVNLLMGVGDGTFQNGVSVGVECDQVLVAVADFNGDGLLDILASASSQGGFNILPGNGNGTFQPAIAQFIYTTRLEYSPVAVSDFNGDGRLDFAYYAVGAVFVRLGNGDGTFYSGGKITGAGNFNTSSSTITLGNFSGDGRPDLAVVDKTHNNVSILLGTDCCSLSISRIGNGTGSVSSTQAGLNCSDTFCSATFNLGQVVPLTPYPATGSLFVGWAGDSDCEDGTVTMTAYTVCVARFDKTQSILTRLRGDFNGDGQSDILWQDTVGHSIVWVMDGLNLSSSSPFGPGSLWSVQGRGDFDGDGKSEILWQRTGGGTDVTFLQLAPGSTGSGTYLVMAYGTGWTVKQIGDFNGDGKSDILWQHSDGSGAVWYMDDPAKWSGVLISGPGTGWNAQQVGDFNGDAKSDIVWQHTDGSTAIGLNTNSRTTVLGPGTGWSVKQLADFNGDGNSDILWQHTDGSVAIWLMNGVNRSSGSVVLGASTGWSPIQTGDFDGDGNSDILWQHSDGSVAIWLMNGLNMSSGALVLGPGTGWSPNRIGDFDGDGISDILWEHSDGHAAIWLMNGLNVSGAAGLPGPGAGWSLAP